MNPGSFLNFYTAFVNTGIAGWSFSPKPSSTNIFYSSASGFGICFINYGSDINWAWVFPRIFLNIYNFIRYLSILIINLT